jgi:predicted transcriptional regulator
MGSEGVTAQAVGKQLKLDKSSARRRLHGATDAGLIKNLETRKFQPGLYRTTDVDQDTQELLPTVNELLDGWCTVARLLATVTTWERWQNPLPPFLSPLSYCF